LATDQGVDGNIYARADAEAHTAADVNVDGSGAHVDRQVVQSVDTESEAATDVVVASVDAHREVGRHIFDTEVQSCTRVTDAEASPITGLRESCTGAEGGNG